MSLQHILASVIQDTFHKEVGKNQGRRTHQDGLTIPKQLQGQGQGKALKVRFKTATDYDTEEGYRFVDLVIYAPMNYVQVWVKKSWDVIPTDDLEYEDGESFIKKGKSYIKGSDPWTKIADHDSCWTEGVDQVLKGEFGKVTTLDNIHSDHWYEIVEFSSLKTDEQS